MIKYFPRLLSFEDKVYELMRPTTKKSDRRVKFVFQPKAWCEMNIMKSWVSEDWDNHLLNPTAPGSTGKFLFADIHRA